MGKQVMGGKAASKQQPERMAKQRFAILPGFYPAVYQVLGALPLRQGHYVSGGFSRTRRLAPRAANRNPRTRLAIELSIKLLDCLGIEPMVDAPIGLAIA